MSDESVRQLIRDVIRDMGKHMWPKDDPSLCGRLKELVQRNIEMAKGELRRDRPDYSEVKKLLSRASNYRDLGLGACPSYFKE